MCRRSSNIFRHGTPARSATTLPLLPPMELQQCSKRKKVLPKRGEVWLFDCGMVEKVRPVLILSVPFQDIDRAVVTVVFHTTALRGSRFEIKVNVPFLKSGAFIAQSIATYPTIRALRKLGTLSTNQFVEVEAAVFGWLGRPQQ